MPKKDRYVPPMSPIPKKDRYAPPHTTDEILSPEILPPTPGLDKKLSKLLGISLSYPHDQNVLSFYYNTIPERMRLRGYRKLADKVSDTFNTLHTAQAAKLNLIKLLREEQLLKIDEKYDLELRELTRQAEIAEAKARKAEAEQRERIAREFE